MRTKLQLIDKFRRSSWLKGRDNYYFVLRAVDGSGNQAKIYESKVARECYYRFDLGDFVFSRNPGAVELFAPMEEDAF